MTKKMTRNAWLPNYWSRTLTSPWYINRRLSSLLFFFCLFGLALNSTLSFATVDSPVVQGLGGANRAGISREALFANPASVSLLTNAFGFFHYEIPKIPDFNAGGRAFSAGLYDSGDKSWKGGIGYSRTSRARILNNGQQGYIDRSEFRFATGHNIMGKIEGGLTGRWINNNNSANNPSHYPEGDLGILFPLFADMRGGITYENILNKEDEAPTTVGLGANYSLGYGFQLYADGYRLMSGTRTGERGWALAAELGLSSDFFARAGLFEEGYRGNKGWSIGGSWLGPRASFDYALKVAGKGPKERSHILGVTLSL